MSSLGSTSSAPDGGYGWVIAFCSFMIHFLGPGMLLSLSVMYVSWLEEFQSSRGLTSWTISLAIAMFLSIGPLASSVASRFGYRATVVLGGLLFCLGFCLSFFATNITMLIICIGGISGSGCGFCYLPAIAAVAVYFRKKRSLALGLATSGTGIGSFVSAPVYHWLIETYGWRGALLIAGACQLNLCALGLLMRPPKQTTLEEEHLVYESKADTEGSQALIPTGTDKVNETQYLQHCGTNLGTNGVCTRKHIKTNDEKCPKAHLSPDGEVCPRIHESSNLKECPRIHIESNGKIFSRGLLESDHSCQIIVPNGVTKIAGGSLNHLAQPRDNFCRPFSSVSELSNKKAILSNGAGRKSHLALDLLMSGSIHSLSMIDRGVPGTRLKGNYNGPGIQLNDCPDETELSQCESRNFICENDTSTISRCNRSRCVTFLLTVFSDFALLRKPDFLMLIISNTLTNLSYLMPVLYMVDRAMASGISKGSAAMLVSVYGIGNVMGRLLCGFIGDRNIMDRTVWYTMVLAICGLATCLSPLCGESVLLHGVYAFIFGFTIGAFTTLVPMVTVDIVGVSLVGQAYGVVLLFSGIPGAFGPPLAGLIYDWTGDFTASFVLHGVFVLLSALVLLPVVLRRSLQK